MRPTMSLAGPSRLGLHVFSRSFASTPISSATLWDDSPAGRRPPRPTPRPQSVQKPPRYEDSEFETRPSNGSSWHKAKMLKNKQIAQEKRDHQYRRTMGSDRDMINPARPERDFQSVGFGVPGSIDGTEISTDTFDVRHPGAPPKQRDLVEDTVRHQFKEGGFKDTYYHDPFADSTVSDSVDYLREALYPSIPHRGAPAPVDPVKVVECCQRLSPPSKDISSSSSNLRLVPLDPYVDKIFSVLVPEYSTGVLPTPVHQLEVLEVLERCLGRVIHHQTSPDWRKDFDKAAKQYASVLIHQARISQHDPARLETLLRHLDRTLEHYANTTNYYIPVPLVSTLVLLMKLSGQDFRPSKRGEFYSFVWPNPELVILPDLTLHDVTTIYHKRPLPFIPSTTFALDKTLRELCIEDSGVEFTRLWRRYRDLYDTPNRYISNTLLDESLRKGALSIFYYRLTHHLAKDRDWKPSNWRIVPLDELKEEILSRIPKPYPAKVLHGMIYAQTIASQEPNDQSLDIVQRTKLLSDIWRLSQESGSRDIKFYGLFVTALGYCNQPELVRKAWEKCIDDADCRTEGPWPPTDFLNQVLAALLRSGGEGTKWALSLFNQACADTSSVQIDHYTLASVLEHYARTGQVAEMQRLIEIGAKHGLEPNAIIYGTLIKGMLRAGQFDLVDSTLKLMTTNGITPSTRLFPTLVAGLCQGGDMDGLREAERLMALAQKHNVEITVFTWASLIGGYFTGGWSEDGWDAVRRMEESGVEFTRVAYNMIIKEAGKTVGRDTEAIGVELVKRMMKDRIYPGHKTWEYLLLPLVKAEKWEQAQQIVDMMEGTRTAKTSSDLRKMLFSVQWRRKWKS